MGFPLLDLILKKDEEEYSTDDDEVSDQEWISKGLIMAEGLEDYCVHRFCQTEEERKADLKNALEICLDGYDSIPNEVRQSKYERAMYVYLRGRMLNALPEYNKEAEMHLSQAVMLWPDLGDAWRCLGNCFMKLGDYVRAKGYFSLALIKGENKKAEYQLSVSEVLHGPVSENPMEHINEGIRHAKEAVKLDDKDGYCWYTLGSAYIGSFLQTGEWNFDTLQHALDAYEKAKTDNKMKRCPDMLYECATVNTFMENYARALTDLQTCSDVYPVFDAPQHASIMIRLLDKLDELLQVKGKGKSKGKGKGKSKGKTEETSLPSLISSLANMDLNPSYQRGKLDLLTEGINKGIAVIGQVLYSVKNGKIYPLYYILCDSEEKRFVVTLHGIRNHAMKQGDVVTLLEPYCKFVDFEWKNKHYKFKSVRVNLLEQAYVNGKCMSFDLAMREPLCRELVV